MTDTDFQQFTCTIPNCFRKLFIVGNLDRSGSVFGCWSSIELVFTAVFRDSVLVLFAFIPSYNTGRGLYIFETDGRGGPGRYLIADINFYDFACILLV